MRFPCEYVTANFLPSIRLKIAHLLREKGLSQMEIADKLKVKQPVIASYLKKEPNRDGSFIDVYTEELAEEVAEMLIQNDQLPKVMRKVCTACKRLRMDGSICDIHKTMVPELSHIIHCSICRGEDMSEEHAERIAILDHLAGTFENLKKMPNITYIIPEIGTQLAHCSNQAKRIDEVASFPGRIIKVRDTIETVRSPEFGASKTMSKLLMWIRQYQPDINWCISIKNRQEIQKALDKLKIPTIKTEGLDTNWEQTLAEVEKKPEVKTFKVLMDAGSPGYEAIGYVFASNNKELTSLISQIIQSIIS